MRALDRKLLRDFWRLRGPALAIALVIASGVATYVLSHATIDSLLVTREAFYREARFAEVFAAVKRAPEALAPRIRELPGVRVAETRISTQGRVDVDGFSDLVSALVLSLPHASTGLNRLYLRAGRLPDGEREVAINEAFAQAHGLRPGARLGLTLEGRKRTVTVSGIVLSPEFVYLIRLGDVFPDYKRYGVVWMARAPLAAAAGLEGAFNNVALTLAPDAEEPAVIRALDRLLAPWGGTGAIARRDQLSHRYLSDEIRQLEAQAAVVPAVFLGVAAFLLNIVMSRLMAQERVQTALLKAFGYGNGTIVAHYLKLVLAIVVIGCAIGLYAGAELGAGLSSMYSRFFRYPFLHFELRPGVALTAVAITLATAVAGALFAVLRSALAPPAAGMRPEPPPRYRRSIIDRLGIGAWLSPPGRMIVRHLARRPLKSLLTMTGIALASATLTIGGFMEDAIDEILDIQFGRAHRADLTVSFTQPLPPSALHALAALPGVHRVEPLRAADVVVRAGHRERRLALQGFAPDARLHRMLDERLRAQPLPAAGVLLTDHLARRLGVRPGDRVELEWLQGRRRRGELLVAGTVYEATGYGAYMDLAAMNRWLGDGERVSGALLDADDDAIGAIHAELKRMPAVLGAWERQVALHSFRDTMGENLLIFAFVNLVLASSIAVGVIYNGMRIALSERERELASLRVLGFTRAEAAYVLLGEIGLLTLVALPLGGALGYGFCAWLSDRLGSDLYRVPVVLEPSTYAYAAVVVLTASLLSALLMLRRLYRLDLVSALKVPQ